MITKEEMQALERDCGISQLVLMEHAGKAVAQALKDKKRVKNKRILIIAYHGNNGGDGFVAARYLCEESEVDVLFVGQDDKFTHETRINFKKIENNDMIQVLNLEAIDFSDYDFIIDAIFGTGVHGEIRDPLRTLISKVNKSKAFKVSIDVPSGVDPNTGTAASVFFEPDLVVAMHAMKKGLADFADKTVIADIGIKQ